MIILISHAQGFPTIHLFAIWLANGECDSRRQGNKQAGAGDRSLESPLVSPRARYGLVLGIFLNTWLLGLYPFCLAYLPGLRLGRLRRPGPEASDSLKLPESARRAGGPGPGRRLTVAR